MERKSIETNRHEDVQWWQESIVIQFFDLSCMRAFETSYRIRVCTLRVIRLAVPQYRFVRVTFAWLLRISRPSHENRNETPRIRLRIEMPRAPSLHRSIPLITPYCSPVAFRISYVFNYSRRNWMSDRKRNKEKELVHYACTCILSVAYSTLILYCKWL